MGFLTGEQKKISMVCQKKRHGFFKRRKEKRFLTGEQKKATWVSEKAAWFF